jgi:hypothetical protein
MRNAGVDPKVMSMRLARAVERAVRAISQAYKNPRNSIDAETITSRDSGGGEEHCGKPVTGSAGRPLGIHDPRRYYDHGWKG